MRVCGNMMTEKAEKYPMKSMASTERSAFLHGLSKVWTTVDRCGVVCHRDSGASLMKPDA
jgi:hypothetical protein